MFPSGACLYYGRVSPADIPQVVKETILKGKILAGLLRGANNVMRQDLLQGDAALDKKDKWCGKKGTNLLSW